MTSLVQTPETSTGRQVRLLPAEIVQIVLRLETDKKQAIWIPVCPGCMLDHMTQVTEILTQIDDGDSSAAEHLLPLVYDELRKLAAKELSHEREDPTLQPTALVHEAYLRLVGSHEPQKWSHRGHFYCAAAHAMRRILIDHARRKKAFKRGGERARISLDERLVAEPTEDADILAIDEVLEKLEQEQPELAKLVSLRFFAGLTMPQAAKAMGIALRTAERKWTYAKAWILEEMARE